MKKRIEKKLKVFFNTIAKFILAQPIKAPVSNYDRILVIRPGGLGDMILTIPILKSIRTKNPGSLIDVLCEDKNSIPLDGLNIIDNSYKFCKNLISLVKVTIILKRNEYHYILNLIAYPSFTFGILSRIIAPNGIRVAGDQREYSFFYNRIIDIPPKNQQHMIERLFMLASDISLKKNYSIKPWFDYGINFNKEAELIFNSLVSRLDLKNNKPRIILVNLSAGIKRREWTIDKYEEFLKIASTKYDGFIDGWAVLTSPKDTNKSKLLVKNLDPNKFIEVPIIMDFRMVITLLKFFFLIITPDTSLVHAASAIGTPVLDLILRENVVPWSPIGTKNKLVIPLGSNDISMLEVKEVLTNFEFFLEHLRTTNI